MKWAIALALTFSLAGVQCEAATTKKHVAKKGAAAHTASHPANAAAKKGSVRTVSTRKGKGRGRTRVPAGPVVQARPDPERYQQIQQALADRGYYKGPVTGEWNDDSVDALKRFQTDQKLDADGKINSLSLIGLGLGPRHEGAALQSSSGPAPATPPATSAATPAN